MATITVLPHEELCPEGATFEAPAGISLCQALLDQHIEIEHACAMSCACTTCHVVVREGYDDVNEASERGGRPAGHGLGPGARITPVSVKVKLEDDTKLVIEIPKYTINHAKEDH